MNYFFMLGLIVACVVSGLAGLTVGINFNPASTVTFVPNWGSVGDWVAGTGALMAVVVSLLLARRDDSEKITAEVGVQAMLDQGAEGFGLFLRAASIGRSPTTIVQVGVCVDDIPESFCPVAAFTNDSDALPKYLARGQIFEAALNVAGITKVAKRFYEKVDGKASRLHFEVRTGVKTYRVKPSAAAFDLMMMAFESQARYSEHRDSVS